MKKLTLLAVLLIPAIAFSQEAKEKMGTMNGLPYFTATESETGHGTVLAVDAKVRDVTIKTADGDTLILTCGPGVKNFAQIKTGDAIKVKYTETLTIHVEESGTPSMTTEKASSEAKMGDMPKGSVSEKAQMSATITAIDTTKGTATLKGYRGNEVEITPRHRENLNKVKVGQLVVFTYEHALAASIERVPAAKPASSTAKKK
jgi:hypothetical protein